MDGTSTTWNLMDRLRHLICLSAMIFLPSTIAVAGQMQLGPITFSVVPSHPPIALGASPLQDDQIGGIVFRSVAEPEAGLRVLSAWYDAKQPDGQRLAVKVSTPAGTVTTFAFSGLYDWQLVPIAHLAKDNTDELVTLFGSLENHSETLMLRKQGHLIVNVHPVLQNTLLGLRLVQADMLLLSPPTKNGASLPTFIKEVVCDLPMEKGIYILGAGETPPSLSANKQTYDRMNKFRTEFFRNIGLGRAYVIHDDPTEIGFSVSAGGFSLTGNPSWAFWRYRADSPEFLDQLSTDLAPQVAERLKAERHPPESSRKRAIEIYNALWYDALTSEEAREMEWMPEEASLSLSAQINQAEGGNPTVYQALVNTMLYRAFFRHLFHQDTAMYLRFVQSLPPLLRLKNISTPAIIPIGSLHNISTSPQ